MGDGEWGGGGGGGGGVNFKFLGLVEVTSILLGFSIFIYFVHYRFIVLISVLSYLKDSGKYLCSVYRKGVGSNSIYCAGCSHWVHKKCSVIGSLKSNPDYCCSRCKGTACPIDGRPHNECLLVQDKKLDVVDSFCYLGDTICAGGGGDLSVITRIRSAWGKFRELLRILTSHALSYITRGQIYSMYIRTVLLYAGECWAPNFNDLLKLQRNDM